MPIEWRRKPPLTPPEEGGILPPLWGGLGRGCFLTFYSYIAIQKLKTKTIYAN